ncbi:transmembrane protein 187 [Echinops telfairi]|uniref:Transmembrane protein 187 n=1 Tax=Echinops telfairi TaxID=9371 RepID=A0ABM0J981_ECHTE|nr:transmembrane protein 187 [Echinops telfairi]
MEWALRQALLHVALAGCFCVATIYMGVFQDVFVQVGYECYAEAPVASLPAFLTMPFNSLINVAYMLLGWHWLRRDGGPLRCSAEAPRARYLQAVFAAMALLYGPVQWLRIGTQAHPAAVLDQWLTLPIFAWLVVWCLYLDKGWKPWLFFATECLSLSSYGLALLHPWGFEVALGVHILVAVVQALQAQARSGNATTRAYLILGFLSCLGFVVLKLWDHQLAQWRLFQRLTGHFWSKVCDVLQFHFAFLFLTTLNRHQSFPAEEKKRKL